MWFVVVCGSLWWFVVVCGGLWCLVPPDFDDLNQKLQFICAILVFMSRTNFSLS